MRSSVANWKRKSHPTPNIKHCRYRCFCFPPSYYRARLRGTKKTNHVLQPQHISNVPSGCLTPPQITQPQSQNNLVRLHGTRIAYSQHPTTSQVIENDGFSFLSLSREDKTLGYIFPSFMNKLLSNDSSTGNAPVQRLSLPSIQLLR
jgi:hypothetical protein